MCRNILFRYVGFCPRFFKFGKKYKLFNLFFLLVFPRLEVILINIILESASRDTG